MEGGDTHEKSGEKSDKNRGEERKVIKEKRGNKILKKEEIKEILEQ